MPVPRAVESGLMRAAGEHPDRGDYFGALGYGEIEDQFGSGIVDRDRDHVVAVLVGYRISEYVPSREITPPDKPEGL